MKLRNAITAFAAAGLVAGSMNVSAATVDGSLGLTSTGTQDVTLGITDLAKVTGIAAIGLGNYTGTGGLSQSDTMCVYRNGTGSYSVTLTSANAAAGAFRLNAGTNFVTYAVDWTDNGTVGTTTGVASGTAVTGQGGDASSQTCGGVDNATLAVGVTEAALQAAPTGSYTDVITILVSPT